MTLGFLWVKDKGGVMIKSYGCCQESGSWSGDGDAWAGRRPVGLEEVPEEHEGVVG